MKKILFATSALVAAGFIAGSAQAADPIKLSVGGFHTSTIGMASQDDDFEKNGTDYTGGDIYSNSEIHFKGSTKLDSGITVSVKMEIEAETAGAGGTQDENVVTISSPSLGTLLIGSEDFVSNIAHHSAPSFAMGMEESDIPNFVKAPSAVTWHDRTSWKPEDDSDKIQYLSPRFMGFGVAFGFTPDSQQGTRGVTDSTASSNKEAYVAALVFDGEVAGVKVGFDGGYGSQQGTASVQDLDAWQLGLSLGFGGITFGAGYANLDQKAESGVSTSLLDGSVWNAGFSYEQGPWGVNLSYFKSEMKGSNTTAGDDTVEMIELGGKYVLGPGVTAYASLFGAEYDDETTTKSANNEGWGVAGGLQLSF